MTKHRQALLEGLGSSEESETITSVAVKQEEIGEEDDANMLDGAERKFRSLAATHNYKSQDRPDVQYAAQELCTKMAHPTPGSWKTPKKAARYPKSVEKVTRTMRAEETRRDAG